MAQQRPNHTNPIWRNPTRPAGDVDLARFITDTFPGHLGADDILAGEDPIVVAIRLLTQFAEWMPG